MWIRISYQHPNYTKPSMSLPNKSSTDVVLVSLGAQGLGIRQGDIESARDIPQRSAPGGIIDDSDRACHYQ